jgi:RHS repeat-associated protein
MFTQLSTYAALTRRPFNTLVNAACLATALFAQSALAQQTVVGSIPAEFSVNSGSASYSIPIQVAPGRGGMQPDLSLNYTGGGNGVLGVGWSLGGLSSIHRCAANLEQDGFVAGITFSDKDRYCLDGQRLIPVSGANGAVGTEYRTEIDGYAQIKSYGGTASQPEYFIAKTKSGQLIQFGNLGSSSLHFSGLGTTAWAVSQISDTTADGNSVNFQYFTNQNTQYLSSVSYTNARVEMHYEDLTDQSTSFFRGHKVKQVKRLQSIETFYRDQLLKSYTPTYEKVGVNGQSQLTAVQECDVNNNCYEPTLFEWEEQEADTFSYWSSSGYIGSTSDYQHYFADVNGDGRTDLIQVSKTSNSGSIALGQADGTFDVWSSHTIYTGSTKYYSHHFVDVNGDGRADLVQMSNTTASGSVSLATPSGQFTSWFYHTPFMGAVNLYQHQFADVNGDGLADLIQISRTVNSGSIALAQGDGTFNFWSSHTLYLGKSQDYSHFFLDFNGDGQSDFIKISYRYNSGSAALSNAKGSYDTWFKHSPYIGSVNKYNHYFVDVNGDGASDLVQISTTAPSLTIGLGTPVRSVLTKITDVSGNATSISYRRLTDASIYTKSSDAVYPVIDIQNSQSVVSQVETSNGVGGTSTVNYHYEGLKTHVRGRGSYGYAKITETYPDTGKSQETYFNQTGFPLVGNVDRVVEKLNGQVINESSKTYQITKNFRKVIGDPIICKQGGNCPSNISEVDHYYSVNLDQSTDKSYELNGDLVTTVTTSHSNIDAYGNIGSVSVTTSANGESFTKSTNSTYYNDTNNWYLGRLSESTVTHQAPNQADQQRRSQFTYDSSTGLLVSESVMSMATGLPLTTTSYQYDAYGHKTQVTVSAPSSTNNETPRTSTTVYNSEGKPTQSCNQLNQCESYTYTPEGWVQSTTGPNGITTTWEYDSFGRKTKEIRADGTETTIAPHFVSAGACGILATHAYTCSISQSTGSQPAIVQYDALGRELRKIATGFDGRLIYSDTEYNHLAQVTRVSRNYFMGDQVYWANSEYDALGRVIQMDEPAPHGTRNIIATSYNGLNTTVTSGPEQRQKTTQTNAIGQVIHRGEEEGSYVEYTYTADGNLKTTTVAGDSSTTITLSYDEFGRKIGMDDPDMGVWSYVYNAFGQLISQTDAKNQTTTMSYDILGRMVSRTDDFQGPAEATSTWAYGDASAPQGSIGKLLSESDGHITKTYFYDNLGRPEEVTTDIGNGNSASEGSFSTQTLYDSLGRVSRTLYPGNDNFYTENLYNANGFLEKVRGLRSNSEQYDLSQLLPLVSDAVTLATEYSVQASQLRDIGEFYESKIAQYQTLVSGYESQLTTAKQQYATSIQQQGIHFEQGSTSGLATGVAYDYLRGSNGTYYIRVPDTFVPIYSDVTVPILLPSTYHYRITDSGSQQTITQISAATFASVESSLQSNGQIYVHDSNTIYSASIYNTYIAALNQAQTQLASGMAQEYGLTQAQLSQHQTALNNAVNTAQTNSGDFYGHLNNILVELQTVNDLINTQVQQYDDVVEQLTVLAEQTLAAADNSFQYERTLTRGGQVYTQLVNDTQYTNYWQAIDVDASGRISAEVYGNGIVNDYTYNQATGQLQHIHSGLLVINPIRHLEYQYDAYQNVTSREDHANDIRETYEYDRLDRLTRTDITSATYISTEFNGSQTQDYDALGNITYKSDVGAYTYGTGIANGAGIHAVVGAGNKSYQYDANGNMTSGDGRTVAWSSFNKPTLITKGTSSAAFSYDASRARYKKVNHLGDITLYVGSLYEKHTKGVGTANESVDEKHYIYANGQLVAEHIVSSTAGVQTRYLHKDALGSVDLVTDAYANVVDRRSFDSWGKLRNLTWKDSEGITNPLYLTQLPFTNKGYTGHENIQEVDLIHMNGRVYDASLARFMSADPFIQALGLSQSYNRYAYTINNPMKYTDPSGYLFGIGSSLKKIGRSIDRGFRGTLRTFERIVSKAYQNTIGAVFKALAKVPILNTIANIAVCATGNVYACTEFSFHSNYAQTGSLSQAFRAGVRTYATNRLVDGDIQVGEIDHVTRIGRGIVKSVLDPGLSKEQEQQSIEQVRSDVDGGTSSQLGGGKFGNGASSASFQLNLNSRGNGITGYDSDGIPGFDRSHPRFHSYKLANWCLKSTRGCTLDNVKAGLLRYPAPGASGTPIRDEQTGYAIPVGTVRHEVYDAGALVVNVTLEAQFKKHSRHLLHPGIVKRWVTEDVFGVTVHTYGEGTGPLPGPNEFFAEGLWGRVDDNIFDYVKGR